MVATVSYFENIYNLGADNNGFLVGKNINKS